VALRALIYLQPFWMRKGRWSEGREASERVLALTADVESRARWNALGQTGDLLLRLGKTAEARPYFEDAVAVAERVGGAELAQMILGDLGEIAAREGDFEGAELLYQRALEAAKALGEKEAATLCLAHLSQIASRRGDLRRAWNLGNEALDEAEDLGWDELAFGLRTLLGVYALQRDDLPTARSVFLDALASAEKLGYVEPVANLLFYLASVYLRENNPDAAAKHLHDALTRASELEASDDLVESLEATARLASLKGEDGLACRLLAASDVVRDTNGFTRPPDETESYDALLTQLRSRCPHFDTSWDEGMAAGLALSVESALEYLEPMRAETAAESNSDSRR
jgi:tetratricopeptide (TPR) repeat protein